MSSIVKLESVGENGTTFDDFCDALPPEEPRYGFCLVAGKMIFVFWQPENASVGKKMEYANSKDPLFLKDEFPYQYHVSERDELEEVERRLTLEAAFKMFDLNGDKSLTKEEVIEVLTRKTGAELTQAEAEAKWDEWIAKYDSNKDGKFSYEEFAAAHVAISA